MKSYCVYLAESPSGKKYVGITDNFHTRRLSHLGSARNGGNFQFHQALRKYEGEISWEVIDTASSKKEACYKEIEWIYRLDTYRNGYNMTRGGNIPSLKNLKKIAEYIAKPENQDKRARECGQKPFLVYKVNGDFVGEFDNVKRFCRENNIDRRNFNSCLGNKKEYVEGFIPFYKEKFNKEMLLEIVNKVKQQIRYIEFEVYTVEGNFVGKWGKINDCCKDLKLQKGNVSKCLKGIRKTHKKYVFKLI